MTLATSSHQRASPLLSSSLSSSASSSIIFIVTIVTIIINYHHHHLQHRCRYQTDLSCLLIQDGETAIELAYTCKHKDIVKLFLDSSDKVSLYSIFSNNEKTDTEYNTCMTRFLSCIIMQSYLFQETRKTMHGQIRKLQFQRIKSATSLPNLSKVMIAY